MVFDTFTVVNPKKVAWFGQLSAVAVTWLADNIHIVDTVLAFFVVYSLDLSSCVLFVCFIFKYSLRLFYVLFTIQLVVLSGVY